MAYSGTVSQTVFDTRRVIEHAARRCKLPAQSLSAEHVDIANDLLYLLLSDLANQGTPLWCIQKSIYPLYDGTPYVTTFSGTVDILNANLRWLQQVSGTDVVTATSSVTEFASPAAVSTVGVKWSAAAAPIELARSNDGLTWTIIQSEVPNAGTGEWSWYDLDSSVSAKYFRVRATSGTLDFSQIYLGNTPTEIPLARLNKDDYTNLPNKTFQSNRPLQYWLDRQSLSPVMNLWPVPNSAATVMQIVVWAQRQIMDVGSMTQELELPQRWYEAVVSMLAAKLAMEYIEVDPGIVPMLDAKAQQALYIAQQEERDDSPLNIAPNIGAYTR
ncbi:MAG: hypothetical protein RLZZ387_2638 [Chloroflexota bacterium]|jgi:hypothetical protein